MCWGRAFCEAVDMAFFPMGTPRCLCGGNSGLWREGELRGGTQVEMLGEGVEQKLGFIGTEVEERDFALIVADHAIKAFVGEVIAEAVNSVGIVDCDGNSHFVLKNLLV